ncbi:MAG: hypothetical protein KGV51_00950 [Moraxellaceae bacterium]|nr:hypothetical protein [Moraxellaceae bacterium]
MKNCNNADYSKEIIKDKPINIGINMNYKVEAKANEKDAGTALKMASFGLSVMLILIGISLLILAMKFI